MIKNNIYKKYNLMLYNENKINEFIDTIKTFTKEKRYVIVFRLISPIISYKDIKITYNNFKFLFFDKRKYRKKVSELFVLLNNESDLNNVLDDWPCFTIEKKFLYFIENENFLIEKFNNEEIYNFIENNDVVDIRIENIENSEFFYDLNINDKNYIFMNFSKIYKFINLWDPIGLSKYDSTENYNDVILEIFDKFVYKESELASIIYEIFKKNFSDAFNNTLNDCFLIANMIINL